MKYTFALLAVAMMIGCTNSTKKITEEISEEIHTSATSKEINLMVEDTIDGGMMLLGPINRKGLMSEPFNEWFSENQQAHELDSAAIASLKPLLQDAKITVFMGTWCEDSQREVPALYEILDAAEYDYDNFNIIAVSHDKETPNGLEKGHRIEFVPTLIFTKNGDTLNRIVEYAHQTLEKDMLRILQGEEYTPAYAD